MKKLTTTSQMLQFLSFMTQVRAFSHSYGMLSLSKMEIPCVTS